MSKDFSQVIQAIEENQADMLTLINNWRLMTEQSVAADVTFLYFDGTTSVFPNLKKLVDTYGGAASSSTPGSIVKRDNLGAIFVNRVQVEDNSTTPTQVVNITPTLISVGGSAYGLTVMSIAHNAITLNSGGGQYSNLTYERLSLFPIAVNRPTVSISAIDGLDMYIANTTWPSFNNTLNTRLTGSGPSLNFERVASAGGATSKIELLNTSTNFYIRLYDNNNGQELKLQSTTIDMTGSSPYSSSIKLDRLTDYLYMTNHYLTGSYLRTSNLTPTDLVLTSTLVNPTSVTIHNDSETNLPYIKLEVLNPSPSQSTLKVNELRFTTIAGTNTYLSQTELVINSAFVGICTINTKGYKFNGQEKSIEPILKWRYNGAGLTPGVAAVLNYDTGISSSVSTDAPSLAQVGFVLSDGSTYMASDTRISNNSGTFHIAATNTSGFSAISANILYYNHN